MKTSDIQPGPFSEDQLRQQWNNQADEFNQWDSLDSYEKLAWAQTQALSSGGWPAPTSKESLQVAQPAEASHGPSMEELGPLIAYLSEASCQAASAGRSKDAGMMCWAMQVVSELVDEDAPDPASAVKDSLTAAPSAEGDAAIPDDVREAFAELERRQENLRDFRRLRSALDCGAAPPADGEVAAAIKRLSSMAEHMEPGSLDLWTIENAAFLLEQRHPMLVAVSERLPGPEDCSEEGLCWAWNRTAYTWGLFRLDLTAHSHWLPFHALPLPTEGEGKA